MNTATQARAGYARVSAIAPLPRDTEYRAFAEVTRRLSDLSDSPDAFPRLAEAVYLNLRLWTALAVDVANDDNALPEELRARIFYLAEFTRVHTQKVLRERAPHDVLIEINTAIMRGLNPVPDTPAKTEGTA